MSATYDNLTLRTALDHFREEHSLAEKYAVAGPESKDLLDRHDVIHVLFGLNTELKQEAMADYWSIFASDVKWADACKYFDLPEQKELIAEVGWPKLLGVTIISIPTAIRIAIKARKLQRKWPWNGYEDYLDQPVSEIRREFGIDKLVLN